MLVAADRVGAEEPALAVVEDLLVDKAVDVVWAVLTGLLEVDVVVLVDLWTVYTTQMPCIICLLLLLY